jgi:hypothetical protein
MRGGIGTAKPIFALPIFAQEKEDVKPFPFTPIPAGPQPVL